jgi:hypothetical protein
MTWLDGTTAWAEAIAGLPAGTPLPMRCVLVPRERVAHALRRELVRAGILSLTTRLTMRW